MTHRIKVSLGNGEHVCTPTRVEVQAGDTIIWEGLRVFVVFPNGTPATQGHGPFPAGTPTTVNAKPPLVSGETFHPEIILDGELRQTKGDLIIR
jgi:hypothetical protein